MKINIRGYITHKAAETYSDCADRYALNIENNRFAISDGVSKSFFPDYWAEILVNSFISVEKDSELSIKKCQLDWINKVADKVNSPDVKWYTKNAFIKNESGLATLVTLRFENDKWFAEALGDSFLIFIKKDNSSFDNWVKLSSKPEPVVFDSFPDYYSSRNTQHGESKKIEQPLVEGTFYLMTDALSEWIFNQKEIAIEEIKEKWKSQDEFELCITELRALNFLNNDDSAILIIEVENDMKTEISYSEPSIQDLTELIEKEKLTAGQLSEDKEESFIEDVKSEILANNNSDIQKEEPLKSKIEPILSNAAKSKKKAIVKILKKLSLDDQKNILITLCKEYGVSFTN